MYESIVVGTDGSPRARRAVQHAVELAKLTGATLHVVSAYHPPSHAATFGLAAEVMTVSTMGDDEVRREVEKLLSDLAAEIRREGVKTETYACAGGAAEALLDVAEHQKADLVVVGSRGMTGARRLLGSVPNNVSHHAACSVLVVRTGD